MASPVVEVKMTGWSELQEKLETLPAKAAKKTLRGAAMKAVEIWRAEMARRVRQGFHRFTGKQKSLGVVFGYLARHMRRSARVTGELAVTASVGPPRLGFWALFLEFGTKKMSAKPFIRPAFESRKQDVLDEFKKQLKQGLRDQGLPIE